MIDEIKDYLVENTTLVFGRDLFIGKMPDTITEAVVLSNMSSQKYQYTYNNDFGYSNEMINIRIRGTSNELETRTLALTVQNALENLTNETMGSYHLIRGWFETPMYQLDGADANNNFYYIGVYSMIIERGE